jgi:hypothetical protein
MLKSPSGAHDAARMLLNVLAAPAEARRLAVSEWDRLVRIARAANLFGTLQARIEAAAADFDLPPAVQGQLRSERAAMAYRRKMVELELARLADVLGPLEVLTVLLKGAAYIAQGLRCADGRSVADVDILVPRGRLQEVERTLLEHGWEATPLEPYDDRYYRQWSHEIPPLRYADSALELDVHHAILPPLGRISPDPATLLRRSVAVPQTPFRVLAPADQVLHAVLHLAQDSDCTNRLRDLVDIDGLTREFGAHPAFWADLARRTAECRAARPLWYALRCATHFLGTPVPDAVAAQLRASAPPAPVGALMDWLLGAALMPPDPDRGYARRAHLASSLLLARSVWLRFPPRLFLWHSVVKAVPWLRLRTAPPQP